MTSALPRRSVGRNQYRSSLAFRVVLFRLALVPLLAVAFLGDRPFPAAFLLFIAVATDFMDGWLCRRYSLNASVPRDRYLDSLVDFALVISMFASFAVKGIYPGWMPVLLALVYLQFVATSGFHSPLYDPVGKYLGVFLFGVIGVTILMPRISGELVYAVLGYLVISLASRIYVITHR